MKSSRIPKSFPAVSEPDSNPENHYCIGSNCPKCRRRNRIISRSDLPRTPNHYCLGDGCPKCNSPPTSRSFSTSLPAYAFRPVNTHDESPLFVDPAQYSDSEIMHGASIGASIDTAY